ncbi:MAG: antibiotic biosynthesis monooxygenase [Pseudanabaena frigida]|uniref:Antibiotic biosynthesis monooxygenase n=1 Tax=Pseudanabaena frigida TaxID=945775 RepID=A0A2W4WHX6_9CYAN|nr:MAG: antibiotic biosynthesis monooxygenase [Pseudanabaena frigida]
MILEVAILDVKPDLTEEFESVFKEASAIIASISGYISHELQRCLENKNRYILFVYWQRLEDHTIGFRQSPQYQEWRSLLHHFYDPFPTVEHYESISSNSLNA